MKIRLCAIFALLCAFTSRAEVIERAMPHEVKGVKQSVILLNGDWQFQFSPTSKWTAIKVPGEAAMQGYAIEHDKAFNYRKSVTVPADFVGKRIVLRFDGVYSQAKLWVNGDYVREHNGGFTRWECDVTKFIKPGRKNEIRLEVTDRKDEVSYGSGYAHHPVGGILRDVTLYALPEEHISGFFFQTLLDKKYEDAVLKIGFRSTAEQDVAVSLCDAAGKEILKSLIRAKAGQNIDSLVVKNPVKWDAEHPNLYTLKISTPGYSFSRSVGFRDVRIVGNQMLVNGRAVKLRGACRHDIHPTLGRTTTRELDSLDADIFKRSNMNFVRTSHYPPSQAFLEFCDQMGLYVECETAICFVDTHRQKNYAPANSQNDPAFTDRYMSQLEEMLASFRSHASILFWSVGNECVFGSNFQKSYDWVKATDKTRPVIFSYPGTVGKEAKGYEILSMHYPGVAGTLNQYGASSVGFEGGGIPAIFDEWAHVPCYTYTTLQDDPNIREFWGRSLDMMWSNLFEAKGGLGGAIWGFIDETFMLPAPRVGSPWWIEYAKTAKPADWQGNCVGYGEWGIVDVWRREKPEFWGTKKAYSPIRLLETRVSDFTPNEALVLNVYNRFDHTNLKEVKVRFTLDEMVKVVACPGVEPRDKGVMMTPAYDWKVGDELIVEFLDQADMIIDAYTVKLGTATAAKADRATRRAALTVEDNADELIVRGDGFAVPFNKASGLIHNATSQDEVIIEHGPLLNLDLNVNHNTGAEVRQKARNYIVQDGDWKMASFSHLRNADGGVRVLLVGTYQDIAIRMTINVSTDGELAFDYITVGEPNGWLREAGLKFYVPQAIDSVKWSRQGYWSYYPEANFAGNQGAAPLYNKREVAYGEDPAQSWNLDTRNYYYFADRGANCQQPLTNIAKGMKENICSYTLERSKGSLTVKSDGAELAARINKRADEQLILYVNNRWDYPEIAWGDYCKSLDVTPCYGRIMIQL